MIFVFFSNDQKLSKDMSMASLDTEIRDETCGKNIHHSKQALCNVKVWSGDIHRVSTYERQADRCCHQWHSGTQQSHLLHSVGYSCMWRSSSWDAPCLDGCERQHTHDTDMSHLLADEIIRQKIVYICAGPRTCAEWDILPWRSGSRCASCKARWLRISSFEIEHELQMTKQIKGF